MSDSTPISDAPDAESSQFAAPSGDGVPLIIFSKLPGLAPVKTRLAKSGSLERVEVELLAKAFLHDTLYAAFGATAEPILAAEPAIESAELFAMLKGLPGLALPRSSTLRTIPQRGQTFPERLDCAFLDAAGREGAVLVGSDCPLLSPSLLRIAVDSVKRNRCAIGPTPLGGFYLIALSADARRVFSFSSVFYPGAEGTELERLCSELKRLSLPWDLLELQADVDVDEDLITLRALLAACPTDNNDTEESAATRVRAPCSRAALAVLGFEVSQDEEDSRKLLLARRSRDAA